MPGGPSGHREDSRRSPIFRRRPLAQLAKSAEARNGTIEGWVGLVRADGSVVPCLDARVYLLVRPLDVERIRQQARSDGAYNPRLAHMYLDYAMTNQETSRRTAYAKTRTDARGHFHFSNLPPERWYYVTAQALGAMMVSWQVAVFLGVRERVQVVLTNTNAALPIYTEPARRRPPLR